MAAPAPKPKTVQDVFAQVEDLALKLTGVQQVLGDTAKKVGDVANIETARAQSSVATAPVTLAIAAAVGLGLWLLLKK